MINILVVEDDRDLCELFCSVLSNEGYTLFAAYNGLEAFDILEENEIHLIVTDIQMPHMNGFEFIQNLRFSKYEMPILIVSARDTSFDKKIGFQSGSDDYMVKPIDINELVWRVQALLRRSQIQSQSKVKFLNTEFHKDTLSVQYHNTSIALVQKEFYLLFKLVSEPNRIFTRKQLMDAVWGIDTDSDAHTLDVHISRLRDKFKTNKDFQIVTVRGLGYKVTIND